MCSWAEHERLTLCHVCSGDKGMPVLLLGCKMWQPILRVPRRIKERVFSCGNQKDFLQTNAMFSKALAARGHVVLGLHLTRR